MPASLTSPSIMALKWLLLVTLWGACTATFRMSESYDAWKLSQFPSQVHTPFMFTYKAWVSEDHADSADTGYLVEKVLPAEFVREIFQIPDINRFSATFGFGNPKTAVQNPTVFNELSQPGTTYRVYTDSEPSYQRFVKLMAGFFFSEMARPSASHMAMHSKKGERFFYHNTGGLPLNFNMFSRVADFVNNKEYFSFFNLVAIMKTFEADYVAFGFDFVRTGPRSFTATFRFDFIVRELVLNSLFTTNTAYIPKAMEESTFGKKSLKEDTVLNGETLRYLIKNSPVLLAHGTQEKGGVGRVRTAARNVRPSFLLQHRFVVDVENLDPTTPLNFTLMMVFKTCEYPMLSQHTLTATGGSFTITRRHIRQWKESGDRLPGHIVTFEGRLAPKTLLKVAIPYQQVPKNFEMIESDHLIANVLPSSLLQFEDGPAEHTLSLQNVAFKTKNYDTTIVFAVISVYLVIFCFAFNSITKITED